MANTTHQRNSFPITVAYKRVNKLKPRANCRQQMLQLAIYVRLLVTTELVYFIGLISHSGRYLLLISIWTL